MPIFIELSGRRCLVVGGGAAALAKVRQLLGAGARVEVLAQAPEAGLINWASAGALTLSRRPLEAADLAGASLVFITLDDAAEIQRIKTLATPAGALINVVDQPALCDFTMPAHVDRGPVTIAIGTRGLAPSLARNLRRDIEGLLPERLGELASFAGLYRDAVKATRPTAAARRAFWQAFFDGPAADALLAGDGERAREWMLAAINRDQGAAAGPGRLTLITGAGGDPDLLPLGALRRLHQADLVLASRRAEAVFGDKIRRDARVVLIGDNRDGELAPRYRLRESLDAGEAAVCFADAALAVELRRQFSGDAMVEQFRCGDYLAPGAAADAVVAGGADVLFRAVGG